MEEDWREQGQEEYLSGLHFTWQTYTPYKEGWEHDHCEFCSQKFCNNIESCLTEGYSAEDGYRWVCKQCMIDFQEKYNLLLEK